MVWTGFPAVFVLSCLLVSAAEARPPQPPRPPRQSKELTEQQQENKDEVVRFIREHFPEKAARLNQLKRGNPELFKRKRQELAQEVRRLLELKERDPSAFQVQLDEMRLRDELQRLAREARGLAAGSRERQEAEKQLREAVRKSFDLRQKLKEAEVADLRRRLQELEGSLSRRTERRDQLINERTQELLGSGEEDW
jgi:hypothetical protein